MKTEDEKESKKSTAARGARRWFGLLWKGLKLCAILCIVGFGLTYLYYECENHNWWRKYPKLSKLQEKALSKDLVYYHHYYDSYYDDNVVRNVRTDKTVLHSLNWLRYETGDTLAVFAQSDRRGYLNVLTGEWHLLDPAIKNAYVFSEGRALIGSADSLFVIDTNYKVLARFPMVEEYETNAAKYHCGYLPMVGANGKMGMIDRNGQWALSPRYDKILLGIERFWVLCNESKVAGGDHNLTVPAHRTLIDDSLHVIMEGDWTSMLMDTELDGVVVTDERHWKSLYGFDGKMREPFLILSIDQLTYSTGQKRRVDVLNYVSNGINHYDNEEVDVKATAVLRRYTTEGGYEGLLNPAGQPVTPPIYWRVTAIGEDQYLCMLDQDSETGIVLNGRDLHPCEMPK